MTDPVILDLVVIVPYGDYNRGDKIEDPAAIADAIANHPDNVVQILQEAGTATPYVPPGQTP